MTLHTNKINEFDALLKTFASACKQVEKASHIGVETMGSVYFDLNKLNIAFMRITNPEFKTIYKKQVSDGMKNAIAANKVRWDLQDGYSVQFDRKSGLFDIKPKQRKNPPARAVVDATPEKPSGVTTPDATLQGDGIEPTKKELDLQEQLKNQLASNSGLHEKIKMLEKALTEKNQELAKVQADLAAKSRQYEAVNNALIAAKQVNDNLMAINPATKTRGKKA